MECFCNNCPKCFERIASHQRCQHEGARRLGANVRWCPRCGALFDRGEWTLSDEQVSEIDSRTLVRVVLMAHLEELGERWPPEPPAHYVPDFRIRECSAEEHVDRVLERLELATIATMLRR